MTYGKDLWHQQRRFEARRLGLDPDRKPAECRRIDPASGKVIGMVERPAKSSVGIPAPDGAHSEP